MDWEVGILFLDISKAFEKVRHEGFIFKLSRNCISGKLLYLPLGFLDSRKLHVWLND